MKRARTYDEATKEMDRLKSLAKRSYREAALQLHPDRTGNDPQKTEQFKLLSSVYEEVERLEAPARPRARAVRGRYTFYGATNVGEDATSTASVFRHGNIIFTVRVG